MKVLYRIFRKDPESREGIITVTSGLGIAVNLLLAAAKVIIGALASSIAIISEGINNSADVMTAVLTLLGTKLAGKKPDEKHPFGYGRIEYLTSLIVAVMILVTGAEVLISSVKLIFEPNDELSISYLSLAIVAVSAVIKFVLGLYTIRMGRKADSLALEGVGEDCRNDAFASGITIAAALIFLFFRFSVDAYAGILTSLLIIKAGLEVLGSTVSELLGKPGDAELAGRIYKEIRSTEGVLNAADMMLHNYGPESYSGSVNVEMDHEMTVGGIYQILHKLQLHIMHEYGVTMVFGVYAVDTDHEEVKELRGRIAEFVRGRDHVKSYHAVYLEPETEKIYCDLTVDYQLHDWDALRADFLAYMAEHYPDQQVELTVETEFV